MVKKPGDIALPKDELDSFGVNLESIASLIIFQKNSNN